MVGKAYRTGSSGKTTSADRLQMVELYKSGISVKRIASRFGIDAVSVYRHLRKHAPAGLVGSYSHLHKSGNRGNRGKSKKSCEKSAPMPCPARLPVADTGFIRPLTEAELMVGRSRSHIPIRTEYREQAKEGV